MLKRAVYMGCALLAAFSLQAGMIEFRLDEDRIWLTVRDEPLPRLLEEFAAAGVIVEIAPEAAKTVTGSWHAADIETVLSELLTPFNYQLAWRRETGPFGSITRLIGIRVFRAGFADTAQPLRGVRRIETSFDGKTRFLAREILVGFSPEAALADLHAFLARTGGTVIGANAEIGLYRILLPEGVNIPDLVSQLGNESRIALAEPNYVYDVPQLLPADNGTSGVPAQWDAPPDDSPVAVSVLDSGLKPDDNLSRAVISAYDATHPGAPLAADAAGHGTLMARLAAGLLDPFGSPVGEGVPVVAVKAFADDGFADAFTLMNAMTYAVQNSAGPVSLSWGSETPSRFVENAVRYAIAQDRPVFAAVGNENTGRPMYPAAYPGVIGVAASSGGKLADYSNRGDFADIIAPGSAGGSQGTSVATAYVAHIAALYMKHHPGVSAADTFTALKNAAGPDRMLTEDAVKRLLAK